MINFLDQILVIKGFLPSNLCQSYISNFERRKINVVYEASQNATTGNTSYSSGKTLVIDKNNEIYSEINKKIETALQLWVDHLDKKKMFHIHALKEYLLFPHKIRLLKYEKSLSIHPHVDWDYFTHASVTINLNEGYEGGDFIFFNGKEKVILGQGDALVFPASLFWVHEVSPVTNGARYCINTFIRSVDTEKYNILMKTIHEHRHFQESYKII